MNETPNEPTPSKIVCDKVTKQIEIPKNLTMSEIQMLTPPFMKSAPRPKIRIQPPIISPVQHTPSERFDIWENSSFQSSLHPPEPTLHSGNWSSVSNSTPIPIPKVTQVKNDFGKTKRRTKKSINPKRVAAQIKLKYQNSQLQSQTQTSQLPSSFSNPPYYPQDPAPITHQQTGTSDTKTYCSL
ncbi:uncharacterized protein CELE_F19H6.6 [Caenorhabditis elegans]|uniref:Uncharacterized protein n=1 Tax=Caenorhabditis elegans TaxID=6239 RepID=Q19603_CAEEL|nr:Uncharacterized protein CELE_F19H6.6 [Caenorhabditis elegans]CAA92166.1 Uncharacterized protein CELE_F19H6.6 [Caenorhabditis elegans]|eukprot:NP_510075.1 Uncharacterized protein CELE_F19H6.6 [Caenorhabditis elegans]